MRERSRRRLVHRRALRAENYFSHYICSGDKAGYLAEQNAAKPGKVKVGRSCITFKQLEEPKLGSAMALVQRAEKKATPARRGRLPFAPRRPARRLTAPAHWQNLASP